MIEVQIIVNYLLKIKDYNFILDYIHLYICVLLVLFVFKSLLQLKSKLDINKFANNHKYIKSCKSFYTFIKDGNII